ncbi:HNH endonuclease [Comamonas sp. GB3 AK4-5]|uniref:HNH endonuclease n=1 Tax=Comamonas sp. GB3 AK4-5 TaxID=3231487 RepID=UPI00351EA6C7
MLVQAQLCWIAIKPFDARAPGQLLKRGCSQKEGDSVSSSFEEFIQREADYLAWVTRHPDGFVLNTERKPRAAYMLLHTATCTTVTQYKRDAREDAFTGHGYIKICSTDLNSLLAWMARYGAPSFSGLCRKCQPDVSSIVDHVADQEAFLDAEVCKWLADPLNLQQQLTEVPREPPSFYYAQTKVFKRNPVVVAAVLLRARGFCEQCQAFAPFLRATNNEPYLEVHHKVRLVDGGIDHPDNALALCPNCHRETHFG